MVDGPHEFFSRKNRKKDTADYVRTKGNSHNVTKVNEARIFADGGKARNFFKPLNTRTTRKGERNNPGFLSHAKATSGTANF